MTDETKTPLFAFAGPVLAILLASLGTSIANVALPGMAVGLSAPFATVQWVVIGYLLTLTAFSVEAGRLGDRIGHAAAMRRGLMVFGLASVLAALSPQVWPLIAARMMQGAGASVMIVLPAALLRERAGSRNLGRAIGLLGSASAVGTALGPALGGFLIAGFGWRAVFWLLAAGAGLTLAFLRGGGAQTVALGAPRRSGPLVFAAAVAAFALTFTLAPALGGRIAGAAMLAVVGLLLSLFLRLEGRAATPVVPIALRGCADVWRGLAANALVAAVMMTTLVVAPFLLAQGFGLAPFAMGLAMAVGPVLSAASGVPAGRLVDRHGTARVAQLGVTVMALAVASIAVLVPAAGLWGYLAGVSFLTPGYQLFLAANTTQLLARAKADQRGAVSGLLGLSRNLGLITGAAAMGSLFAWATGKADLTAASPTAILSGTVTAFAVAAALLAGALALLRPVHQDKGLSQRNC